MKSKATGDIQSSLDLDFTPYQVSEFGNCPVVLGHNDRRLTIATIDTHGRLNPIHTVKLDEAGEQLRVPRRMNLSNQYRKMVIRSAYPCPTCPGTQSSDFVFDFSKDQILDQCFSN